MPKVQPIQSSFSSGEVTPLLRGQTPSERYATGVKICENFIPRSQGPLDFRNGFDHVDEFTGVSDDSTDIRLIPFNLSFAQNYVVAIGDQAIEIFDRYGAVIDGAAGLELVTNPGYELGLLGWQPQTVDAAGKPAGAELSEVSWLPDDSLATLDTYLAGDFARLGQGIQPAATGNHVITVSIYTFGATSTLTMKVGTTFNDNSILNQALTAGIGQTFTVNFADTAAKWITFESSGAEGTWLIVSCQCKQQAAGSKVTFASPWAGFARYRIAFEQHPSDASIVFAHPNVAPQELKVDVNNNWSLGAITFTGPPSSWTGTNYPGAITFGQGRSWWGGTPGEPTRFNGSKTNDYYDLTTGTQADSGLEFTISKRGVIRWMSGAKNIIIGTETRENLITAAGGVITSSDIDVQTQSSYGSFAGQHVEIGDKVVYVSAGEQKLRIMGYRWQEDAWTSIDLAWPSEHITAGRIQDVVYVQDPVQLLWMNERIDQNLVVCAYDREQGIVGWARCPTPGLVRAIASTEFAGYGELWALNEYVINGVRKVYVEKYTPNTFQDSKKAHVFVTPSTTVTGADHLEGRTISVKVDGASHPDRTVSGGQFELEAPGTFVEYGLAYTGRVITLPVEGGNARGTAQGTRKRYNRIFLRIYRSVPPRINGELPPDRSPLTPMNLADTEWTEDVDVRNLGWDRVAEVELLHELPFACQISALFGELAGESV